MRSWLAALLVLSTKVWTAAALATVWRLKMKTSNDGALINTIYELSWYDASGNKLSGAYSSSLGNTNIINISDGNPNTGFQFPTTNGVNVVGESIKFTCTGGCQPYSVSIKQSAAQSNRIWSMIVQSSNDGVAWVTESPTFKTDYQNTNYVLPSYVAGQNLTSVDLSTTTAAQSNLFVTTANTNIGYAVGGGCDVNGDLRPDIFVTAPEDYNNNAASAGLVYVIYGDSNPNIDLQSFVSGTKGYKLYGSAAQVKLGMSVSCAGDVNKDGIGDFIIGATGGVASNSAVGGMVFVIYGTTATRGDVTLTSAAYPTSSSNGFRIATITPGAMLGYSSAGVGDVNGDGYADILVGAPNSDFSSRTACGMAFLVYGGAFSGDLEFTPTFAQNAKAFRMMGPENNAAFGRSLAAAGDVNGDGLADIVVGCPACSFPYRGAAGSVFVIFGTRALRGDVDLGYETFPGPLGMQILGASAQSSFGAIVSSAGDFNRDGYSDVVVCAPLRSTGAYSQNGACHVVFGHKNTTTFATFDTTSLAASASGFAVLGSRNQSLLGSSASRAGDFNNDGFDDLIIGAKGDSSAAGASAGAAYVLFGHSSSASFPSKDLSRAVTGVLKIGSPQADAKMGNSVAVVGDYNKDGVSDVLIGATSYKTNGVTSGAAFLVYGAATSVLSSVTPSSAPTAAPTTPRVFESLPVATLNDAVRGFQMTGPHPNSWSGWSVSGGCDVNGDGWDDIFVSSALYYDGITSTAAAIYVVFGGPRNFDNINFSNFPSGPRGFMMYAETSAHLAANPVSCAGDVNKDGIQDFIIGTPLTSRNGFASAGAAYVLYGKTDLSALYDAYVVDSASVGTRGFIVKGFSASGNLGCVVKAAGDYNKDGYADVLVGASAESTPNSAMAQNGHVYVVFGSASRGIINTPFTASATNGFRISGPQSFDQFGSAVSGAGDVNRDGYDDIVVGCPACLVTNRDAAGMVYVLFGKSSSIANVNLNVFVTGVAGYKLIGSTAGWRFGYTVSSAGDMNRDGYADLLIGAPNSDGFTGSVTAGAVHVIFGSGNTTIKDIDVQGFRADRRGFTVYGHGTGTYFGLGLSGPGDVNGDGVDDIVVGASLETNQGLTQAGGAYVLFGRRNSTFSDYVDMNAFVSGPAGYKIIPQYAGGSLGLAISAAGDFNADGVRDIIVSAFQATVGSRTQAGLTYVVYGNDGHTQTRRPTVSPTLAPTAVPTFNPSAKPTIKSTASPSLRVSRPGPVALSLYHTVQATGVSLYDRPQSNFGCAGSRAGDFNNDGYPDILIGAYNNDVSYSNGGAAYLLFGGPTFGDTRDITLLQDTAGFVMYGPGAHASAGLAVSAAGDFNKDGIADIIVGSFRASYSTRTESGMVYIMFGHNASTPFPLVRLDEMVSGKKGIRVIGAYAGDRAGVSVSSIGDFNHDGYSDIIVGAYHSNSKNNARTQAGTAYVLFGREGPRMDIDLQTFVTGASAGFRIWGATAGDIAGRCVGSAGDLNHDGFDDLIVGAEGYLTTTGIAYVIFGTNTNIGDIDLLGFVSGTAGFKIIGMPGDALGHSVGPAGDLNHDGVDDIIVGVMQADPLNRDLAGVTYIIYGKPKAVYGNMPDISAASFISGARGYRIIGRAAGDYSGNSASSAGDLNGDGIDDLVVGALQPPPGGTGAGSAFVVYGTSSYNRSDVDLNDANFPGYMLTGAAAGDGAGGMVSGAGDVNNDGYNDFIVGASSATVNGGAQSGRAYVLYGSTISPSSQPSSQPSRQPTSQPSRPTAIPTIAPTRNPSRSPTISPSSAMPTPYPTIHPTRKPSAAPSTALPTIAPTQNYTGVDVRTLSALNQGFRVIGKHNNDNFAASVSGGCDVNGDGFDDILLGSPYDADTATITGITYVLFGQGAKQNPDLNVVNFVTGTRGFRIIGRETGENQGISVSCGGDMNGDGVGDMIVSSANSGPSTGTVYVVYGTRAAPTDVMLSTFSNSATRGYKIYGRASGSNMAQSVASVGDFNGDGKADVLVGSGTDMDGPSGRANGGMAFLIFGGPSANVDLVSFASGTAGIKIIGSVGSETGSVVSAGGDINGDTFADILIGAPKSAKSSNAAAGMVYVLFGRSSGFADVDLETFVTGTQGFIINGAATNDQLGGAMSRIGDFNADGKDDFIIGARYSNNVVTGGMVEAGAAYVLFGRVTAAWSTQVLSNLESQGNGFAVYGKSVYAHLGSAVSGPGDVNGDGIPDICIGASGETIGSGVDTGAVYVIFGYKTGTAPFPRLTTTQFVSGAKGFKLIGAVAGGNFGNAISSAGDFNNDGVKDLVVGAYKADYFIATGQSSSGAAYVIYGKRGYTAKPTAAPSFVPYLVTNRKDLLLTNLGTTGNPGVKFTGREYQAQLGRSVSMVGDVNGDGLADMIIGEPQSSSSSPNGGAAYLVLGSRTLSTMDMSNFNTGSKGVKLFGSPMDSLSGTSVSGAGDFNGDGLRDFIVGFPFSPAATSGLRGGAAVIFGQRAFTADINLATFPNTIGVRIVGEYVGDSTGSSVAGAGDVNGDKFDDVVVGASQASPGGRNKAGEVYVVFGKATNTADIDLTTFSPSMGFRVLGAASAENLGVSVSTAGDFNRDGYADILIGAKFSSQDGVAQRGRVYMIYGRDTSQVWVDTVDLSTFVSGTTGRVFQGGSPNDHLGHSVSAAGDVNSDGYDDIVFGAVDAELSRNASGLAYVIYGNDDFVGEALDMSTFVSGEKGFRVIGGEVQAGLGSAVGRAGDVNGDGIVDLVVCASKAMLESGVSYLIYGSAGNSRGDLDLGNGVQSTHMRIFGDNFYDGSGNSVSGGGDLNGDGIADVIIGASNANIPTFGVAGTVYVVFGSISSPTSQPSRQPSSQPSRQPTGQPSHRPSRQPTSQPSGQPTAQPNSRPTSQPSTQPSGQPTSQPAGRPSSRPTLQPSGQPSSQPSVRPSSQPSSQPSSHPCRQPIGVPTAQPSGRPSGQPSTQPSSQPSVRPSCQPSGRPSGQPSVRPSRQPSSQPSGRPTAQTSAAPSGQPSSGPSSQPSVRPAGQPSGCPSGQPSMRPSSQPSSRPSTRPTAQPSAVPSGQPSPGPTLQPSVSPTGQPSEAPSAQPTTGPSGQPSSRPTALPSTSPSSGPTAQPSSLPTTQPSSVPSALPTGVPSVQPSGWPSARPSSEPTGVPTSQPSSSPSCRPSGRPTSQPSAGPSGQPSGCPSSQPISLPTSQPSATPTTQPSRQPSSHPSTHPSGQPSSAPTALYNATVELGAIWAVPNITSFVVTEEARTSATVMVTIDGHREALVYCGAFNTITSTLMSTGSIISQNFVTTTLDNAATIALTGLSPSTDYSIYCMTVTLQGKQMNLARASHTVAQTRTLCCKTLTVGLLVSSVYVGKSAQNAISATYDVPPSVGLTVGVSFASTSTPVVVPATTSYPSSIALTASDSLKTARLLRVVAGGQDSVEMVVTLSGPSASEYSVVYTSGRRAVRVISMNVEPPLPVLQLAQFSNDGGSAVLTFDTPTDRAGYSNFFPCESLLAFPGAATSACQWTDNSNMVVYPKYAGGASVLAVDSTITLSAGLMHAKCTSNVTESCSAWAAVPSTSLTVRAPANPTAPVVSFPLPATVSACNSLLIDLTASSGAAGRPWASTDIKVLTSGGETVAAKLLQRFLAANFTYSPPTVVPSSTLSPGYVYSIQATMCNYLGACGTAVRTMTVLSRSEIVPVVSISGQQNRNTYNSATLVMNGVAFTQSCGDVVSYSNLEFSWAVFSVAADGSTSATAIRSVSQNAAVFKLAPHTLSAGSVYDMVLTATSTVSGLKSSAKVTVTVLSGQLVAKIAQGAAVSVQAGSLLAIDASRSIDPNIATLTGWRAGLSFAWTCEQMEPVFNPNCSAILSTLSTHSDINTVRAASAALGATYRFTVTVSDSARSNSASTDVTVTEALQSDLRITNSVASVSSVDSNSALTLTGSLKVHAACAAVWSVDDISVSLAAVARTEVTKTIAPTVGSAAVPFNLVVPGGVLAQRASFTFTLQCGASKTAVTVTTNGAPQPGVFVLSPSSGTEMSTVFTFSADLWLDVDLPLTYQFGYESASSVSNMVIVSATEKSYAQSVLPAGPTTSGNALNCSLFVRDTLGAFAVEYTTVVVSPLSVQNKNTAISALLQSGTGSVDDTKRILSVASAALNQANCSSAPNCTALHRSPCSKSAGECGECLSGYIGTISTSNQPCIATSTLGSPLLGVSCAIDDVCSLSQYCEVATGRCVFPLKTCSKECSYHGTCSFIDTASGRAVTDCSVVDPTCEATCTCASLYSGRACDIRVDDLATVREFRSKLLLSLEELTVSEDVNAQSVKDWSANLYALSLNPFELSQNDINRLLSIANTTVVGARTAGVSDYSSIVGVLQATDAAASVERRNYNPTDYQLLLNTTEFVYQNNSAGRIVAVVSAFADLVSSSKAYGENASVFVYDNFRMSAGLYELSANTSSLTLQSPLSDAELLLGARASTATLSPTLTSSEDSQMAVNVVSVSPQAYAFDTSDFVSNPMHLQVTARDGRAALDAVSSLEFTFQHIADVSEYEHPVEHNFTSQCAGLGASENYTFVCPDSGVVLTNNCSLGAGQYHHKCPKLTPGCGQVGLYSSDVDILSTCKVTSYSASHTTCRCSVGGNSAQSGIRSRRLVGTVENQALSATGASNMLATSSYVVLEFADTFNAASKFNSPDSVIIVIYMFATLWGAGVLILSVCLTKGYVSKREKAKHMSNKVAVATTAVLGGSGASADVAQSKRVLLDYIDGVLPSVYDETKSSMGRMLGELRAHHRYLSVFTLGDGQISLYGKFLILGKLLTVETMQMFVLVVLYDLQGPENDGSCSDHFTESECLSRKSLFDDHVSYCDWDPTPAIGDSACMYNKEELSPKIFLYILVLTSVFTSLISTPLDYLFKVVSAPRIDEARRSQVADSVKKRRRQSSVISGVRRFTTISAEAVQAARRRSVAATGFVKEKVRGFRSFLSVSGSSDAVIANREISEDVEQLHSQAVAVLPSVSIKADTLRKQKHAAALHMKSRALSRRLSGLEGSDTSGSGKDHSSSDGNTALRPASAASTDADGKSHDNLQARAALAELCEDIIAQRELMPKDSPYTSEFDAQWGIQTIARPASTSRTNAFGAYKMTYILSEEARADILESIISSDEQAAELKESMPRYTLHHGGLAVLNLFVLDLLGRTTSAAKIFRNKFEEDFEQTKAVSRWYQMLAVVILLGCNGFFIYYSLLKAFQKGTTWQYKYLQGCIVQIAVELFLNETIECIWLNYVVPDLVRKDVKKATIVINKVVEQITESANARSSRSILFLDAAPYLFSSTKVAQAHPTLLESIVVLHYQSHLPGELSKTWPHCAQVATASQKEADRLANEGKTISERLYQAAPTMILAISTFVVLMLRGLGTMSFGVQRTVLRLMQPMLLSGLTLLWFFASKTTTGLVVMIVACSVLVAAFAWRQYYVHKLEHAAIARTAPGPDEGLMVESDYDFEDIESLPSSRANSPRLVKELSEKKHSLRAIRSVEAFHTCADSGKEGEPTDRADRSVTRPKPLDFFHNSSDGNDFASVQAPDADLAVAVAIDNRHGFFDTSGDESVTARVIDARSPSPHEALQRPSSPLVSSLAPPAPARAPDPFPALDAAKPPASAPLTSSKSGKASLAMFECSTESENGTECPDIDLGEEKEQGEEENVKAPREENRMRSLLVQDARTTTTANALTPMLTAPSAKLSLFDDVSEEDEWDESTDYSIAPAVSALPDSPHKHRVPSQVRGRAPSFFLDDVSSEGNTGASVAWGNPRNMKTAEHASAGAPLSTPAVDRSGAANLNMSSKSVSLSHKTPNQLAMFDSSSSSSAGFDLGSSDGEF